MNQIKTLLAEKYKEIEEE